MAQRNPSQTGKTRKLQQAITITHPNAAGIDIGSSVHYVRIKGVSIAINFNQTKGGGFGILFRITPQA